MNRKKFITALGLSGMGLFLQTANVSRLSKGKKQFFKIEEINGRFFLITPDNKKFFSVGINHIDSASLRYVEGHDRWDTEYFNSHKKWLKHVASELQDWNFNTVGWVQDVVVKSETIRRHSRNFTYEEYQWLNMPYCHMLPFADFHQWEVETRNPDFFSSGFEDWCDYVARDHCGRLKDDPNLIGYFYLDCPTWVHSVFDSPVKGPIFDPEMLKTESGRTEISTTATKYYKLTFDAIKRYDTNHLILGDRYEASQPISEGVIQAAIPYIDVLSFQHFGGPEKIVKNLRYWHHKTGLPTLLADFSHNKMTPSGYLKHKVEDYQKTLQLLREDSSCIGSHLCGAYIANRARKKGLLDENENSNMEQIRAISQANLNIKKWMEDL